MLALLLVATPALAKPPVAVKPVGFGLGLAGAIITHEAGHAVVAKLCGWEIEGFGFYSGKMGIGGATKVKPDGTLEEVKGEYLSILAAGSLLQVIPVLAAPAIARKSGSPYVDATMDYLSTLGSLDFTFYSGKDLMMELLGVPEGKNGDWSRFADLSGVPLVAIFGASLLWSYTLFQFQNRNFNTADSSDNIPPAPSLTLLSVNMLTI
jgi:hypothetical protein